MKMAVSLKMRVLKESSDARFSYTPKSVKKYSSM